MGDKTPVSQAIEMAVPILNNLEIPFIIVADSDDDLETVTSVLEKSSVKERVRIITRHYPSWFRSYLTTFTHQLKTL